jgi:hypothetical protein
MVSQEFPSFGLTLAPDRCGALVGCVIHERYTLDCLIGRGGFGCVFRARQKAPDRLVAVKVSRHDADNADRMVREANLLATLDHPAIARVYDANTWESPIGRRFYVVMELVLGAARLHEYCQQRLPTVRGRVRLFIRVCEAVGIAHDRGIVHRDLKPGNVLVSDSGQPKVIDFGIAKVLGGADLDQPVVAPGGPVAADGDGTRTGSFMGTQPYAAPEQMAGELVTSRSDVHALGKLLEDVFDDRRGSLPSGLKRVIDRCTRRNPQDRYANARALATALERWLLRRTIAARLGAVAAFLLIAFAGWRVSQPLRQPSPWPAELAVGSPATPSDPASLHPGGQPANLDAAATAASDATHRWFVHAGDGKEILVADQTAPLQCFRLPTLEAPGPRPLRFDAAGDRLATTDGDHWRVWITDDFQKNSRGTSLPASIPDGRPADVGPCIDLAADGSRLFGQIGHRELVAIEVADGRLVESVTLAARDERVRVTSICRGPVHDIAYVGSSDGTVSRWHLGRSVERLGQAHGAGPVLLASTPDGSVIASIGSDGTLRLYGSTGKATVADHGLGSPLAITFADTTRLLVATKSMTDSRSRLTRYEPVSNTADHELVVTGTASTPERILNLAASGTTFLAVTLQRVSGPVTELWQPSPPPPKDAGEVTAATVTRASRR